MTEAQSARRLAAIMAADIVGYSRLMEANEERTLASLQQLRREFFDPTVARHRGRIFKMLGDGFLIEFGSVTDATRCAVDVQTGMPDRNEHVPEDRHIKFRVGLHVGDMIIDGEDIYGDGVNIAARLEGLAAPGGIACSAAVRDHVGHKLDLDFIDQGEKSVKNIAQPLHVYFIGIGRNGAGAAEPHSAPSPLHACAAKPSVARDARNWFLNDPDFAAMKHHPRYRQLLELVQGAGEQ